MLERRFFSAELFCFSRLVIDPPVGRKFSLLISQYASDPSVVSYARQEVTLQEESSKLGRQKGFEGPGHSILEPISPLDKVMTISAAADALG